MEWVETTGRTIEEAKDAALDQLGVDEQDAEFEIVSEPKAGLFGRLRVEARVRARVRPTTPRPKVERRGGQSRRRTAEGGNGARSGGAPRNGPSTRNGGGERRRERPERAATTEDAMTTTEPVPMTEQAEVATAFLQGLLDELGLEATLSSTEIDEDTFEVAITGDTLGFLIGPKGETLSAIQDLARTVVQRRTGARNGRLLVDVGGYRQKRKAALEKFTHQIAAQVLASGQATSLEPMHPADRKVVHDTANTIDGVRTTSEGEEPRRYVVILPDS